MSPQTPNATTGRVNGKTRDRARPTPCPPSQGNGELSSTEDFSLCSPSPCGRGGWGVRVLGPVGKRASTREAALSGPLTNYGLHLVTYSNGWTTLAGTAFRADIDISSLFSFCFFFVLFLVRPRKRTKKNGAVRHGAGFSTNCCNGIFKRRRPADQPGKNG